MNTCSCTAGLIQAVDQPTGEPLPSEDWASLTKGEPIALRRGADPAATGIVDVVAADGSVFWVHLDHGHGRVAIHVDDDAEVWRH